MSVATKPAVKAWLHFSEDESRNAELIKDLDYYTLCVIQDATGYIPSAASMARWVESGESFPINPDWPCYQGLNWYLNASKMGKEAA